MEESVDRTFAELVESVKERNRREVDPVVCLSNLQQHYLQEYLKSSDIRKANATLSKELSSVKAENEALHSLDEENERRISEVAFLKNLMKEKEGLLEANSRAMSENEQALRILLTENKSLNEENASLRRNGGKGFVDLVKENQRLKSQLEKYEGAVTCEKRERTVASSSVTEQSPLQIHGPHEEASEEPTSGTHESSNTYLDTGVGLSKGVEVDKYYYPRLSAPRGVAFSHPRPHEGNHVYSIFSLSGNQVATCGGDRRVRLWTLQGEEDRVDRVSLKENRLVSLGKNELPLCLYYNSKNLFCGCDNGNTYVIDPAVPQRSPVSIRGESLQGEHSKVVELCASPSSRHCYTAHSDRVVRIWDCKRRKCVSEIICESSITGIELESFVDDRDDQLFYTAHASGLLQKWDRRTCNSAGKFMASSGVVSMVLGGGSTRFFTRKPQEGKSPSSRFSNVLFTSHKNGSICARDVRQLDKCILDYRAPALVFGNKPMHFSALDDGGKDLLLSVGNASGETLILSYNKMLDDPENAVLNQLTSGSASQPVFDSCWSSAGVPSSPNGLLCGITEDRKLVGWKIF